MIKQSESMSLRSAKVGDFVLVLEPYRIEGFDCIGKVKNIYSAEKTNLGYETTEVVLKGKEGEERVVILSKHQFRTLDSVTCMAEKADVYLLTAESYSYIKDKHVATEYMLFHSLDTARLFVYSMTLFQTKKYLPKASQMLYDNTPNGCPLRVEENILKEGRRLFYIKCPNGRVSLSLKPISIGIETQQMEELYEMYGMRDMLKGMLLTHKYEGQVKRAMEDAVQADHAKPKPTPTLKDAEGAWKYFVRSDAYQDLYWDTIKQFLTEETEHNEGGNEL